MPPMVYIKSNGGGDSRNNAIKDPTPRIHNTSIIAAAVSTACILTDRFISRPVSSHAAYVHSYETKKEF